jgi:hypothetical protein
MASPLVERGAEGKEVGFGTRDWGLGTGDWEKGPARGTSPGATTPNPSP